MNAVPRKILIADDDASIRLVVSQALTRAGYQVRATGAASTLAKWAAEGEGDLVVADVMMPDANLFDVLPQIRRARPRLPVIVMSAQNTLLTAVGATERGAFEYLPKPFDLDDLLAAAERALSPAAPVRQARADARAALEERSPLIGRSNAMQAVYRTLARLVRNDLTVLITGECGVGKSLAARALHDLGPRRNAKFVTVHLAGASPERLEQELFGRDGAGGKIVEADGGALFLHDVGALPLESQTTLLRLLDGAEPILNPKNGRACDVRVVASSHADLAELMNDGLFRPDLYYRLLVATMHLPPLRERVEDIPDLVRAFLLRAHRDGLDPKTADEGAIVRLQAHDWPGNVRELENLMRRIAALYAEPVITAAIVEREIGATRPQPSATVDLSALLERAAAAEVARGEGDLYARVLETMERPLLRATLSAMRGNQVKAAERLGLNRNTLRKKLHELGLSVRGSDGD
jgi:two-component system, NtrC family, nitrogen regulation response regulator GlnG